MYTPQSVRSPTPGSSTPGLAFQALSLMDPFPNRQPDVLPTISEGVPMFDPETFQPLLDPLEAGSENDVSVQKNASSTATPQHITYETPQPFLISDSPSSSSEHGSDLPTPGGKPSLETLVEDPESADLLIAASPVRHSPNPGSSVSALSIRNSTLDEHAPILPSTTTYQSSRLSTYDIFGWEVQESVASQRQTIVSFLLSRNELNSVASEQESELALDQTKEESTHDDPIKLLSREIRIGRQSAKRGEQSQAEREYCSAIQKYIINGGIQTEPLLRIAVMELAQCLNSCPTDEFPSAACICLDLLESLIRASSSTTAICSMILVALKTLFGEYRDMSGGLNLRRIVVALYDPVINLPILQALPSFFETMQEDPATSGSCGNRGFRFGLRSFACVLRRLLEACKSHNDDFSILELRRITLYLRRTKRSFEGTLSKLGLPVNNRYWFFDSFTMDTGHPTTYYWFIEPYVTELASACATAGWFHEAETLFAVLRSFQSLEILGLPRIQRKAEISKLYCLYLKRRKCYAELLSELCDMFTHLANTHSAGTWYGWDLTDLLNGVPLPYDQYVSSEKAHEIGRLEILFSKPAELTVQRALDFDRAISLDFSLQHDLVFERNKSKAMDDDELMEDCESSNKFGVTYTESGMTGISFNYSDLYR